MKWCTPIKGLNFDLTENRDGKRTKNPPMNAVDVEGVDWRLPHVWPFRREGLQARKLKQAEAFVTLPLARTARQLQLECHRQLIITQINGALPRLTLVYN
jgi:hypothetical protein